jgi:drug/metabolite transporter (DMT)-like permease
MNKRVQGTIYVFLSAILFALGGLLIKVVPWSAISIQGGRSIFSLLIILLYMRITKHKFVFNKSVVIGGLLNFAMAITFVAATKMTTAANAIVLQFTEPIFIILLMWIIYKVRPNKAAIITCATVFAGIVCFFFDSLSTGGMIGNILAIISGLAYAFVFMIKKFPGSDFESSIVLSNVLSIVIAIPSVMKESELGMNIWLFVILLGLFQCGLSYVFLSKGLDLVTPVTASLVSTIEPILNPLLVACFYGERVGILAIFGAIMVVGSATIYSIYDSKKTESE